MATVSQDNGVHPLFPFSPCCAGQLPVHQLLCSFGKPCTSHAAHRPICSSAVGHHPEHPLYAVQEVQRSVKQRYVSHAALQHGAVCHCVPMSGEEEKEDGESAVAIDVTSSSQVEEEDVSPACCVSLLSKAVMSSRLLLNLLQLRFWLENYENFLQMMLEIIYACLASQVLPKNLNLVRQHWRHLLPSLSTHAHFTRSYNSSCTRCCTDAMCWTL